MKAERLLYKRKQHSHETDGSKLINDEQIMDKHDNEKQHKAAKW